VRLAASAAWTATALSVLVAGAASSSAHALIEKTAAAANKRIPWVFMTRLRAAKMYEK
jgi:methionine-rich copper-binding protein CopC